MIDVASSYQNISWSYPNALWQPKDSETHGLSVVTKNLVLVSLTEDRSSIVPDGPAWISSHAPFTEDPSLRAYIYQTLGATVEFTKRSDDTEHGDLPDDPVTYGRSVEAQLVESKLSSLLLDGTVLSASAHAAIVNPGREMNHAERADMVGRFAQNDRYALGSIDETLLRLGSVGQI